jgi:hypothetical protein
LYRVYFEDPTATYGHASCVVDEVVGNALLGGTSIRNGGLIELTDANTKRTIWVPASRIIKIESKAEDVQPQRPYADVL